MTSDAYFEQLATEHSLIRSSKIVRKFYRYGLEEVLAGIKNARYPYVSLDKPEFKLHKTQGQRTKRRMIAFSIVEKFELDNFDSKGAASDRIERICDDFFTRMKHDLEEGLGPFIEVDFDSVSAVSLPTNTVDRTIGLYVVFEAAEAFDDIYNPKSWINGN